MKIWVVFRHPYDKQIGHIQIEVSRRADTIPPRMLDGIEARRLITYDGEVFLFRTLAPEEIVAEKIIRLFRVDKGEGPRQQDLHDIGFLYLVIGVDDAVVSALFADLVADEGHLCRFDAAAIDGIGATVSPDHIDGYDEYDHGKVSDAEIVQRIRTGIAHAKRIAHV